MINELIIILKSSFFIALTVLCYNAYRKSNVLLVKYLTLFFAIFALAEIPGVLGIFILGISIHEAMEMLALLVVIYGVYGARG